MTMTWEGSDELAELFWSAGIVRRPDGLSLADHRVIADENGDVVEEFMGYADTAFEEISATTWARKTFVVDDPAMKDVTLCVAGTKRRGSGKLAGRWNGEPFAVPARSNCSPWYSDWRLIPAPLRTGENELILRATGSLVWRLFIAPGPLPNRSARSVDAGVTWDDEHLGLGGFIDGEYCIRLSGTQFASEGVVTSPPVQVRDGNAGSVPPAGRVTALDVTTNVRADVEVRLGTGPWLDRAGVWTGWRLLTADAAEALEAELGEPGPRFAQFRLTLTPNRRRAPVLKRVTLAATLEPAADVDPPVVRVDKPPTVLAGRHFAHQRASDKLAFLRETFDVDEVFGSGEDAWDGLLRLAAWVGDYCGHRKKSVELIPKIIYDAHTMLELGHERRMPVYCGGLAFVLVQLGASLGLTGRVVCRGNHLVTEFWSPVHRKWAVVDPMDQQPDPETGETKVWTEGFGGFYHAGDGIPMSAIDLATTRSAVTRRHYVWEADTYEERPATVERDLRWYRREISYTERNNCTDAAEPLFRADVFRYSGHLKWRRPGMNEMPWYPNYTSRRGDIEWTVGETSPFLTAMPGGAVLVQLRSQLPNTVAYDLGPLGRIEDDSYRWSAAEMNELTVRAVNALGQAGPATTCTTESWTGLAKKEASDAT
ncbi:MAG: hypothetical protein R6V58_04090 [Planctomycetota bacterium]